MRLTKKEKRLLIATVVMLATKAMFEHHGIGGLKFRQKEGGPIGLRGTCILARLVMQIFDKKWVGLVQGGGMYLKLYMRYMDDGRALLQALKRGWRWRNNRLVYCLRWEQEDVKRSQLEVTVEAVKESMKGVTNFLKFTYETGEDYQDGWLWLPTLDSNLKVSPTNTVLYKFYEKPTTINTTILRASAMAENPKVQSLSNELVRRLLNTKEDLPKEYRAEVY